MAPPCLEPTMTEWLEELRYDPLPSILGSKCAPVVFFAKRDLLGENPGQMQAPWADAQSQRICAKQRPDGRWEYPGGGNPRIRAPDDYDQLETYRQLGLLVEEFGLDRTHPVIGRAARFLFAHQTSEGDFRGIYGRQYSPNYTAGIIELLVKAGFGKDKRIERGFNWLLSIRQDDGGWAIPFRTAQLALHLKWTEALKSEPIPPDRLRPFSHLVTGVVLRAFAAHEKYRQSAEARAAAEMICGRFFKADSYIDRKGPEYWERVTFPFWFTDVVSTLDSLSLLRFRSEHPGVREALAWLAERQTSDGLFKLKLLKDKDRNLKYWACLAICRVFKRFYGAKSPVSWSE